MENNNLSINVSLNVGHGYVDGYGHINNSAFPMIFELGRKALQHRLGLEDSALRNRGIGLFVTSANYQYIGQVREGDKVDIKSAILPYNGGIRLYMKHLMTSNGNIVAKAKTEHVFVNLNTNKPIRRPLEELLHIFS